MGDLSPLTRGYCADLQLPEDPERLKYYKKLCSIDPQNGSLEHARKHLWMLAAVAPMLRPLSHSSTARCLNYEEEPNSRPRSLSCPLRSSGLLCRVCLEAERTPARDAASNNAVILLLLRLGGTRFFVADSLLGTRPLASLQRANRLPCFGCPRIPAGRGAPSLTRGVRAWQSWLPPSCSGSPLWRVPQGLAFFFPRPRPLPTLRPPTCTHLCLSSDLASYY